MLELPWLDHLPDANIESGMQRVNQLYWNITFASNGQRSIAKAGEDVILRTDSQEALQAFLYGMSLAYNVFPKEVFERLRADVRKLVE